MPGISFPIGGIVRDSSGTPVSGAVVTCFDVNTREWLKNTAQSTTNSLGEYTIDLYNLDLGYSNLDTLQLMAISGTDRGFITNNLDTVTGFLIQDIILNARADDMYGRMNIGRAVNQIGTNITISDVSSVLNSRGDATETETKYLSYAVVEVFGGDEIVSKEGIINKDDLRVFIDIFAPATEKIKEHSYIYWKGKRYIIKMLDDNKSYLELHCQIY